MIVYAVFYEYYDDYKLLGIYSTLDKAEAAQHQYEQANACVYIRPVELDVDLGQDG